MFKIRKNNFEKKNEKLLYLNYFYSESNNSYLIKIY